MKKSIIVLASLLTVSFAGAQDLKEADVPAAVKEAFKKKFPDVKKTEWEKEGANYEVEFDVVRVPMDDPKAKKQEIEKSAVYTATGELVQIEEEIPVSSLPKAVADYVTKNYAGKKISEAAKITESNGTVMYEAEVGKEDLIFDVNGNFVKKEVEADDKDDDKEKKK